MSDLVGRCLSTNVANSLFDGLEKKEIVPPSALLDLDNALQAARVRTITRFNEALSSNATAPFSRMRIMFVGQGKAGKSATGEFYLLNLSSADLKIALGIVRSLLGKPFNPDWDSTIGADISTGITSKRCWTKTNMKADFASELATILMEKQSRDSSKSRKIWDKLKSNLSPTEKEVPYPDYPDKENLIEEKQKRSFLGVSKDPPEEPEKHFLLDSDLDPLRDVSKARETSAHDLVKKKKARKEIQRYYNSDLISNVKGNSDSLTLSLWDFGGQQTFYTMHHIFLTKSGIYLLVFDLRSFLVPGDSVESLEYVRFWLQSIQLHAPDAPLFLVGTFSDQVDSNMVKIDSLIRSTVKGFSCQIASNEPTIFYPVDNMSENGVDILRSDVEKYARGDESMKQGSIGSMDGVLRRNHFKQD